MPIYQDYARIYDRSGQLGFSKRMLNYIDQLLGVHPTQGNRMLDLACGTGTVAIGMALKGWQVQGIDGSAAMLQQAQAKSSSAEIKWSQQDMRRFTTAEPVDLATCLYDSLNYMLTDADLVSVFRQVYAALRPNGLFIFDMNTAWVMANRWDGTCFVTDNDEFTSIMQTHYDGRHQRTLVTVTCFERQEEHYTKSKEEHIEQAYPLAQVSSDLTCVGLTIEAVYDCFTMRPAQENNERVLWVARKPAVDDAYYL